MATSINNYIETVKHLRARAEYTSRSSLYFQGMMSPQEALLAFQTFGYVNLIDEYVDGVKVPIWEDGNWNEDNLERILSGFKFKKDTN